MIRKLTALVAACAIVFTALAPAAEARRHRDGYYDGHYDQRYRRHDHDNDAAAIGVVGLIVGLAIGSMASQNNEPRYACRDNYQRCAPPPPPRCSQRCDDGYYQDQRYQEDERYYEDQGRYEDRGDAYAREYGLEGGADPRYEEPRYEDSRPQCTRRERQWDRYAERYVTVDVPC